METKSKLKGFGAVIGVLFILLGLLCAIRPELVMEFIIWIFGCALLVGGLAQCMKTVAKRKELLENDQSFVLNIIPGIVLIVLSGIVLIYEGLTLFMIGIIIGIGAIFLAFERFGIAKMRKKSGERSAPTILMGIIQLLFGGFMIYGTVFMELVVVVMIGLYLITTGVMVILSSLLFHDL